MDILPTEAVAVVIGSILLFVLFVNVLVLMFKFIPILLWAAVGLISSKIFKKDLTYGESVKIMLYGNTLPTIITTIYWVVFKDNINMFTFFVLVSIYTGYFIYQLNTGEIQKEGISDTITPTQDTNPMPTQTPTPPETVETIRPIQQSQQGMENIQKEAVVSNLEEENK